MLLESERVQYFCTKTFTPASTLFRGERVGAFPNQLITLIAFIKKK